MQTIHYDHLILIWISITNLQNIQIVSYFLLTQQNKQQFSSNNNTKQYQVKLSKSKNIQNLHNTSLSFYHKLHKNQSINSLFSIFKKQEHDRQYILNMLTQSNILQTQFQFNNIEQNQKQYLKKSRLKRQSKKNSDDKPKGFYYNIQVIRKVATFLQNVKTGAVRQQINLKPQDLAYLHNEDDENMNDENLFSYGNKFIVVIEIIVLFASMYCLWKNSYELIFGRFQEISLTSIPALFIQIFYKVVYFNTQQRNLKLQIISKRKEILKNYLRQFALFDFFYFLGYILEYIDNIYIFYPSKMLGLCIFVTFSAIYDKLENIFARTPTIETMMSLIKLLLKIIVFIHFLSLMFNLLTIVQKQNGIDVTWVQHNFDQQLGSFAKYINGWYWGTTILSTVGFGDITPANVYQRGFFSFVQVFCCAMFGYCVNYIGTMIGVFGQSKATYQKDIRRLNYYLKTVKIPQTLKNQIRSHFYNKYQIQQVYSPQSQQYLFKKFTDKITKDIKQNNNLNIIGQSEPIKIFSEQARQKLAGYLNKVVYAPSEMVFQEFSAKNRLYIIQDGQINEIPINKKYNKKVKPLYTFSNDSPQSKNTLGWFNFITGDQYKTCAKASKFSITYQLLRDDFLSIIKEFKNDYYKFLQLKEKFTFNPCVSVKDCIICGRLTHNVSRCPRIHFIPKQISSLVLHEKKNNANINIRRYQRRQKRNRTKLNYSAFEDQIDEIIENNMQNNPYVSRKRISMDKMQSSITRNQLAPSRYANQQNEDMASFRPKRVSSIISNKSIQSILGGRDQVCESRTKYSVHQQLGIQNIAKTQKLKKIESVMFDQTQYYFPNSHVEIVLGNMSTFLNKGRKAIHFISEPKTMSIKFIKEKKFPPRGFTLKSNTLALDEEF